MADTGFSASDAVLTSAMSGGFNNGFGGGGSWGGGYGGAPFADMGSNAVRLNRNNEVNKSENRCIEGVLGANLDRISDQNKETRDTLRFDSIKDGQFQGEIRNGDRLRDIEREMTANARTAAECCCDTQKELLKIAAANEKCCCEIKLQSCNDKAEILAAIASSESRGVERDRNTLQAELISLKTQVACNCNCPS